MATSGLDTTSVECKVVRENLVQLHCEDVSWEQATDKIPLDLVRYLLGDLVPHLSTSVFLRGNRCLFTIDWTNIPNSYAVWQYMVDNSFHKRTAMQVAHYHFTFMLSHVGPSMKTWLTYTVKLIWENPILVLGKRMYGYKVHYNLWSIQKCYIYPLICQGQLPRKLNHSLEMILLG